MDFELTKEQKMIRDSIVKFSSNEIQPFAEEIDQAGRFPHDLWQKLADLGFVGMTVDPEYGGAGTDLMSAFLVCEELAKSCSCLAVSWGAHDNLCCNNLNENANESQKKKFLPALCSGKAIGALALTEPNAGSDAVNLKLAAKRDGDFYSLNGTKTFITNGPIADTVIVYAKTNKNAGAKGITAFILDTKTPGFSVSKEIKKVGNRCSPTGELILQGCRVPVEDRIGEENSGISVMMRGLDIERAFFSAHGLGVSEAAFQEAVKYSKEREQFGKPICSFQLIQAKLADMYVQIEALKLLCYKAVMLAESAKRGGKGTEVHKVSSAAVLYSGEVAAKVTQEAIQIHGGYGYCMEFPVQRYWRDAKLATIGAGTSEIRRLIIAKEILND